MRSIKSKRAPRYPFRNSLLVIGGVVALMVAYAGIAYAAKIWPFHTTNGQSSQDSNHTTPKTQSSATNSSQSTTTTPSTPAPGTTNSTKNTPIDSTPQPSSSGTISIPFAQQSGDTLRITTLITDVKDTGTCTLTLTKDSTAITLPSVGIQAGPSSSTCQGFNISISSQPQLTAGTWTISIVVDSNSTKASATSKVTIR